LTAGLCSGLTLGFMSIDELSLELKLHNGTIEEKKMANKILSIVENHHNLLVTLMLSNAFAMEYYNF
jgi:metal transporter CNNM